MRVSKDALHLLDWFVVFAWIVFGVGITTYVVESKQNSVVIDIDFRTNRKVVVADRPIDLVKKFDQGCVQLTPGPIQRVLSRQAVINYKTKPIPRGLQFRDEAGNLFLISQWSQDGKVLTLTRPSNIIPIEVAMSVKPGDCNSRKVEHQKSQDSKTFQNTINPNTWPGNTKVIVLDNRWRHIVTPLGSCLRADPIAKVEFININQGLTKLRSATGKKERVVFIKKPAGTCSN